MQSLKMGLSSRPLDLTVSLRTVIGEGVTFLESVEVEDFLTVVEWVSAIYVVDWGCGVSCIKRRGVRGSALMVRYFVAIVDVLGCSNKTSKCCCGGV